VQLWRSSRAPLLMPCADLAALNDFMALTNGQSNRDSFLFCAFMTGVDKVAWESKQTGTHFESNNINLKYISLEF